MRLFAGDDRAEDHHDVEVMDETGQVLARRGLPDGAVGIAQLHELIGQCLGKYADEAKVIVGIQTGRGSWVTAPAAADYAVFPVNPLQASRYQEQRRRPARKATAATRTCLRTWCEPILISCARAPRNPAAGRMLSVVPVSVTRWAGASRRSHPWPFTLAVHPGRTLV